MSKPKLVIRQKMLEWVFGKLYTKFLKQEAKEKENIQNLIKEAEEIRNARNRKIVDCAYHQLKAVIEPINDGLKFVDPNLKVHVFVKQGSLNLKEKRISVLISVRNTIDAKNESYERPLDEDVDVEKEYTLNDHLLHTISEANIQINNISGVVEGIKKSLSKRSDLYAYNYDERGKFKILMDNLHGYLNEEERKSLDQISNKFNLIIDNDLQPIDEDPFFSQQPIAGTI